MAYRGRAEAGVRTLGSIELILRDLNRDLVAAWQREFAGVAGVTVGCGDIFTEQPARATVFDAISVRADAEVSPANSFGFMDGGIDAVYTQRLGAQVQARLRERLARAFGGELPVGQAVVVATGRPEIPWCISAPTMRVPADVSDTVNAYRALRAVLEHNRVATAPIERVLCPGLGTDVGRMPAARCARQMRAAWESVESGTGWIPESLVEAVVEGRRATGTVFGSSETGA